MRRLLAGAEHRADARRAERRGHGERGVLRGERERAAGGERDVAVLHRRDQRRDLRRVIRARRGRRRVGRVVRGVGGADARRAARDPLVFVGRAAHVVHQPRAVRGHLDHVRVPPVPVRQHLHRLVLLPRLPLARAASARAGALARARSLRLAVCAPAVGGEEGGVALLGVAGRGLALRRVAPALLEVGWRALDHLLDAEAVRIVHCALLPVIGEARHAQAPAFQGLPRVLPCVDLVRDLLPSARSLVRRVELHEPPGEARTAVGARAAFERKRSAVELCCDQIALEDATAVFEEGESETCNAVNVAEHERKRVIAFRESGVENGVVSDLLEHAIRNGGNGPVIRNLIASTDGSEQVLALFFQEMKNLLHPEMDARIRSVIHHNVFRV
mmetsp:Transcript_62994/g.148345  ORF Transcript_62994/g.148345 Transcript_62994/m.148345 type:complete len:388 (-) Transcript_62994:568-1731(-)